MITWFAFIESAVGDADIARVESIVGATPRLHHAHVYTPASAYDPYTENPPPPALALQLYFGAIGDMEAALAPEGHLQALARALPGARATQQAMISRQWAVREPGFRGAKPCTFLVHYPGQAEDFNAWLWYYVTHHPQLMVEMAGIREVEVCSRIDWCGFLPWSRANVMQRNKVAFDSQAALDASLASEVRTRMREDYDRFPPFTGANIHFPMFTKVIASR